jgi:hypothetical protein
MLTAIKFLNLLMLPSYYYVLAVLRIVVEGDGDGPGVDA